MAQCRHTHQAAEVGVPARRSSSRLSQSGLETRLPLKLPTVAKAATAAPEVNRRCRALLMVSLRGRSYYLVTARMAKRDVNRSLGRWFSPEEREASRQARAEAVRP
jgi:hypothetical protein